MKTNIPIQTFGGELEKAVAELATGEMALVSQQYFQELAVEAKKRGTFESFHKSDLKSEVIVGTVSKDLGEQGLDNGFNLVETSLPYTTSLTELHKKMLTDLTSVQNALRKEGKSVINLAIHPLGKRDYETYSTAVAPKGVYPYIWYRGWDHAAGIDARAQNSPATGVTVDNAADAVSVIIGAGAAFIGLFGNSPFEEGKRSLYKESRLTMWPRMMKHAKVEGDRRTSRFPEQRFRTMAQYFTWMFGGDSGIHFVLGPGEDAQSGYKSIGERILLIEGIPSVLEYLSKPSWGAYYLKDMSSSFPPKKSLNVVPVISHMETMQFAQFTGARIRYGLEHEGFPLLEFVEACQKEKLYGVEDIFRKFANFIYIEGRDPGANFPDEELMELGADVANSTMIAPSAFQAGLLQNIQKAVSYIDGFPWKKLGALREAAIRDGLEGEADGTSVYEFARKLVDIASEGLSHDEQSFMAYVQWVLKTRRNGADRAIAFVENHSGNIEDTLKILIKSRFVSITQSS